MIRINTIIDQILSYRPQANIDLIQKAYIFSAKVHEGQVRLSGETYLSHPLEVAWYLTQMKMDQVTIAAGLLHDTIEDTLATPEIILEKFGPEILHIVNGVTKISAIHFQSQEERQAENIRKMILAMSDDIRVILVKLADRLHNMRTLGFHPQEKQKAIAQETLEIYAPISARLGMRRIQAELEDLCLYYLEPESYQIIKDGVAKKREERERYIREVKELLQKKMDAAKLSCRLEGRPKHFYSIYKKMIDQNLDISQLYDLIAFRFIVKKVAECYEALGHIHSLWKPIPGKFRDYISLPKANGYQSLHTKVIGPIGERIEIQIRTEEMHRVAEEGIASHWQYKEGQHDGETDAKKFQWVRQLLESQKVNQDPREFLESVRIDLFPDEVYVFTPRGAVKMLPKGATPIDFAYAIHTDVGHHCTGARVNKKMVPLRTVLQHGDVVEIITASNHVPSKDWVKIVKTSKAKNRIRQWIKAEERIRSIDIGKDLLEKELRKNQSGVSQQMKSDSLLRMAQEFSLRKADDLLAAIGFGKISIRQVINRMFPKAEGEEKKEPDSIDFPVRRHPPKEKGGVLIRGIQDVMTRFAKCCTPLPGDPVVGFITRGRGITVHARTCPQVVAEDPERLIEVQWEATDRTFYPVKIEIWSTDKKGMLAEVSTAITSAESNILKADASTTNDKKAFYQFMIEVTDTHHLESVMNNLKKIKGVLNVTRSFERKG
ncbi:MAG: bifunctional (p)ppGpp synthetase/guanosine-3',5'-bis(diphosphate) 3'-pyrophosphohydrolase [Pseudomonadota bacterium]